MTVCIESVESLQRALTTALVEPGSHLIEAVV